METDVIDQPVEVTIMEVVGEALKGVVDQLNVRLVTIQTDLEGVLDQREAALRAEISKRCDQLENGDVVGLRFTGTGCQQRNITIITQTTS